MKLEESSLCTPDIEISVVIPTLIERNIE